MGTVIAENLVLQPQAPPQAPPRRGLLRCRATQTVVLAGVMLLAMGLLRDHEEFGLPPDLFWRMKVDWNGCADIVLAGDSRVYRAVSPEAISAGLGNCRVLNYGFSANGYCSEYLAGLERVLDPQSQRRTLVLGISPHSLTPNAIKENGYLHTLRRQRQEAAPATEALLAGYCPGVLHFFKPMSFSEALRTALGIGHHKKMRYISHYRLDGWVPGRQIPETGGQAIKRYAGIFEKNRICPDDIDGLLAAVKGWTARGIKVYAFRPPSSAEMVELENACSGLDEAKFVRDFQAAGGQWIAVDQARYHSYDGSHLRDDAAEQFSHDLARQIDGLGKSINAGP